jgi:Flp pilus assembly secretin CpaC
MKYVSSICVAVTLSITAYGQQTGTDPHGVAPAQLQPDSTGQRLQHLRKIAYELEQAGYRDQAAATRRQAEQERQRLLRRLDVLQAEAEQIRQAIGAGTQVVVQLQVVEVSLTKLRQMGFDVTKLPGDPDAKPNTDQTEGKAGPFLANQGSEARQVLEALRKDNLVKVLAEPTLATLSGKTAVFNSGGKLPAPQPQKDGSVTIEQQHGTVVEVTPEVLGDKVHLAIHARLADPDQGNVTSVGRQAAAGNRVLEFDTRAEFKSGQTLAFRGPTEVRVEAENRGLPWGSDVPYVGALLRSVKESRNELAIFILVRPEIVQPPSQSPRVAAGSQGDVPAPQTARPANSSGIASPSTARRPATGEPRR